MLRGAKPTEMQELHAIRRASLEPMAWVYGLLLPLAYVVVELSFNDQLIRTLGDNVPDNALSGLDLHTIRGYGRGRLQPNAPAFDTWVSQPRTVRESSRSLGRCQRNRQ